jgi:hypothetical protein
VERRGQLFDRAGEPIQGTNIIDLVRYSINTTKSFTKNRQPTGWNDFQGRLEDANVPNVLAPGLYANNDLRASYLKRKTPPSSLTPARSIKKPRAIANTVRRNPLRTTRLWDKY